MELRSLMSGIAVVIDDKIRFAERNEDDNGQDEDLINLIVEQFQEAWRLPFYKSKNMPLEETWPNLLQAASFILLDWRLWPENAGELESVTIGMIIRFLEQAKNYFVPVFIFTNETLDDVEDELPQSVYSQDSPERNFIFLQQKNDLIAENDSLNFKIIEDWIEHNASVYALKTWEQAFYNAKKNLFSCMYTRNPNWPKVFWKAYDADGVDPRSSLTQLINDCLRGRMQAGDFEKKVLGNLETKVPREDLKALIGEISFRPGNTLPDDEIRCGDLFQLSEKKYLINIKPDCDCVPRKNQKIENVKLFCIQGIVIRDEDLKYENGHFNEKVWESIAFASCENKNLQFDFKKLRIKKFAEIKDNRVGRLLHPYLTRIQQRYALYQQRQGLPRIPAEAVQFSFPYSENYYFRD